MNKTVNKICEACFNAIRKATYDYYYNYDSDKFEGTFAVVNLPGTSKANIEVDVDEHNNFEVLIDHKSDNETPRLEEAIADYLYDNNADPVGQWYKAQEDAIGDMKEAC